MQKIIELTNESNKIKKEVLSYDKLLEERDNQDKLFKIPIKKNI